MIDLRKLYNEYPQCFKNSAKFRAYLSDLYPTEKKARINVLTTMLEEGRSLLPKRTISLQSIRFAINCVTITDTIEILWGNALRCLRILSNLSLQYLI